MGILANENAISSGNYIISNSLRFQSASSQYLSRTPASAGSQTTWSWSAWVKRGQLGTAVNDLFSAWGGSTSLHNAIRFEANDTLNVYQYNGAFVWQLQTTQVFRDPSAWYHIVVAIDTTQATAANRVKIYINGSQITAFSTATYPTQNSTTYLNAAQIHALGATYTTAPAEYFDGYMAEVNFVNALQLTPSSFGASDPVTGQWVAAKYTGTYGTNGFYLPFSNGTSTTTLGSDSSGNGNNWTLTNFTRSAGVSDCWMYDVPSGNGSPTATQPSSNYAVLNYVDSGNQTGFTLSKSNLTYSLGTASVWTSARGTVLITSGKWYWEVIPSNTQNCGIGIAKSDYAYQSTFTSTSAYGIAQSGDKIVNGSVSAYTTAYAANDVIGVAFDADNGTLTFYKNNASLGTAATGITIPTSGFLPFVWGGATTAQGSINFGQRSFAYTPPSGFKALCTANLPVATIKKGNQYMDATTYSGNLVGQSITNAGSFKPDLVWVKSRSAATDNKLTDSVRGAQTALVSNTTAAETTDLTGVVSFNTNGFTLGTSTTYNNTGATYVGWQWQAGQGTTSSNTSGSITSTVSVNATAGFSIVTYTGTGANATVGHGLGVAPKMVIVKQRSAINSWIVWQTSIANTDFLRLETTAATATAANIWNSTSPTSTVFSLGTSGAVNTSTGTYVAYCFAEIAGFSKFGSYTGNGSADGPFIYTGFTPKFVMLKLSSTTSDWVILDTSRDPYNQETAALYPDLSIAEDPSGMIIDGLSNGFKIRKTSFNTNGATGIYMAFASNPFANSNAR